MAHVAFPGADGSGLVVYGGNNGSAMSDEWALGWESPSLPPERCLSRIDGDGDGAIR